MSRPLKFAAFECLLALLSLQACSSVSEPPAVAATTVAAGGGLDWRRVMDLVYDKGYVDIESAHQLPDGCWAVSTFVLRERTTVFVDRQGDTEEEFPPASCQ